MLNITYALISIITAISLGVFFARRDKIADNLDYLLAIIGGIVWPFTICIILINCMLGNFKQLCEYINNQIDKAEERIRLEKEAAKSKNS